MESWYEVEYLPSDRSGWRQGRHDRDGKQRMTLEEATAIHRKLSYPRLKYRIVKVAIVEIIEK
jgi:hypothetical protein